MPQENVEQARKAVTAINESYRTGDLGPWRRHVERAFDPEVVLELGQGVFTEGEWRGLDGAIGFVENQMEVLEDMWLRADEVIDVDDECLVVALTFGGKARHTGIDVELSPVHVFRLRDGRVVRWQIFQTRGEALEAAGLS
jgi:ketosteroid isomerase-like protein